ncbi:carbonic anhydrase [Demequina sp. NBRC 110053]|uniref:beta-class carbonic anhydrase n=1 Tax=Demequina sp. NBRC 110053 TaxID=1570342 RepID=UPI001185E984|nr:carbonic anhydrase [Demequina sp. NBRC 110053]
MGIADELIENNAAYAATFEPEPQGAPSRQVAIVACMDARLDPLPVLGLEVGQAHVIRNAGGIVSNDALRSLVISQRKLGTREVVIVQHTACGMMTITDEGFVEELREDVGEAPSWAPGAFGDLEQSVRDSVERVRSDPFLVDTAHVRGLIFDVQTGAVREVV